MNVATGKYWETMKRSARLSQENPDRNMVPVTTDFGENIRHLQDTADVVGGNLRVKYFDQLNQNVVTFNVERGKTPFLTGVENQSPPENVYLSPDIEVYNGRGDPEEHLARFVRTTMRNRWSMPIAYHLFDRTLTHLAKIWTDSLPRGSVLHFGDLEDRFRSFFKSALSHAKIFSEVHNIKQQEEEDTWAFLDWYEKETSQKIGLGSRLCISGLVQGLKDQKRLQFHSAYLEDDF